MPLKKVKSKKQEETDSFKILWDILFNGTARTESALYNTLMLETIVS